MAFQVSAGINVSEVDLSAGAQQVSVSDAAFAGPFQWGPALEIQNIASEDDLVRVFGKPTDDNYEYWFSAQSFLAYSNLLRVVRALPSGSLNATAASKPVDGAVDATGGSATFTGSSNAFSTTGMSAGQSIVIDGADYTVNSIVNSTAFTVTTAPVANVTAGNVEVWGVLIENGTAYENDYPDGVSGFGAVVAKYPGTLGNGLKLSTCTTANAFSSSPTGTVTITAGSNVVTGSGTSFNTDLKVGDSVVANGQSLSVSSITNATHMVMTSASTKAGTFTSGSWSRKWEYASLFNGAPGTSNYAATRGGSNDEMHVAVVDSLGKFTGVPGTVLERYAYVSKASDAKDDNGDQNYWKEVLNTKSKYVWWLDSSDTTDTNWGSAAANTTFGGDALPNAVTLSGGLSDASAIADAELEQAYDLFASKDVVDISLVITGPASTTLASYIIQNICETRLDCVAFVSPRKATVVNNSGSEVTDIIAHRNSLPSSSYGFMDSGWKYQLDKYNNKYRWVPLNGDMAGLAARTDSAQDPWYSPAGFSRGGVKNAIKLAFNPKQQDRDDLYKVGVNPVVSLPGSGTILYGDKTLLDRPSSFDRINVRRLFIILEKTISRMARAQLFEFNDDFTRSQFRNIVEPYLRDVKSRRGVTDYRVICDESNNTDEVVEQNRFVGDIYVKPSKSINYIQLNFVAVRNGVSFQEVVGQIS